MGILYVIAVVIGIIGIVSTLFVAGNIDANYGKSTRRNVTNLIFIYTALFIVLIAGLWYAVATF